MLWTTELASFDEVGSLVVIGFLRVPFGSEVAAIGIANRDNVHFEFGN